MNTISVLSMKSVGKCWRGDPLSDTGKRQQILQILSLTLLPILGLWAFTVYSVSDSIKGKTDLEQVSDYSTFERGDKVVPLLKQVNYY